MEDTVRMLLLITGILLLFWVIWDIWWRQRTQQLNHTPVTNNKSSSLSLGTTEKIRAKTLVPTQPVSPVTNTNTKTTQFSSVAIHNPEFSNKQQIITEKEKHNTLTGAATESHKNSSTSPSNPGQTEQSQHKQQSDITSGRDFITITIQARDPNGFPGHRLLHAFKDSKLQFGEFNIFHRYQYPETKTNKLFSVCAAVEPGEFRLDTLSNQFIKGVTLFYTIQDVEKPHMVFDLIIKTAKQMAFSLNGHLLDKKYNPLTQNTLHDYHDLINEICPKAS